jgi:hypothetical protein
MSLEDGIPTRSVSPVKSSRFSTHLTAVAPSMMPGVPSEAGLVSSRVIQQHLRNLKGIQESRWVGEPLVVADDIPRPSLGARAERYLCAHGYDLASQLQIAHAYQDSGSSVDFVNRMSNMGMAIMESQFLCNEIIEGMAQYTD